MRMSGKLKAPMHAGCVLCCLQGVHQPRVHHVGVIRLSYIRAALQLASGLYHGWLHHDVDNSARPNNLYCLAG